MNNASWKREVSKLFNFLKFSPPGTRITSIDVILEILDRTLIDRWMKETRRLGGVGFQIHPHTVGKTDRLDYSLSRSLSCSRNEAESDWRAESRTNGRNFGGRRVTASYGGAKITGCLATRPFTIIDIHTYIHTFIYSEEGSILPSVLDKMTPRITVQLPFNSSNPALNKMLPRIQKHRKPLF